MTAKMSIRFLFHESAQQDPAAQGFEFRVGGFDPIAKLFTGYSPSLA